MASRNRSEPSVTSHIERMPSEIHGYRVIDHLGDGAASRLYVVSDPKTRELRALKLVQATGRHGRRFLEQAEREHEVASRVSESTVRRSLRIIRYREILRTTEVAVILEFVDGEPLDGVGRLAWADLLGVFADTADGLAHLHGLGWAHADLKPGNILRTGPGRATIIDLGQACRLGDRKTRIQGTPGFLAPEQVDLGPIDTRTDAFLLGATIYRRLTGFPASSALLEATGPRRSLDRLVASAPAPLVELVESCLEPLPGRRPSNLSLVASRLRAMAEATAGTRSSAARQPA